MHASLHTNLLRKLMGFLGFSMAGRAFAGDTCVPRLRRGVRRAVRVRLRVEVLRMAPFDQGEQWSGVAWGGRR